MMNNMVLRLTFVLLFFINHLSFGQSPANDDCDDASFVRFGQTGFETGKYVSDTVSLTNATTESGEFFHSDMVTAGLNRKSIWFSFYLPVKRGVNIELRQPGNSIGSSDAGFVTSKGDSCFPTSQNITDAFITPLNQFGSSFHPCLEAGWYKVQVCARNTVSGDVFVEFTVTHPFQHSNVNNALYDSTGHAYRFGTLGKSELTVNYNTGCHTIDDTLEVCTGLGSDYRDYLQSSWHTFTTGSIIDFLEFRLASSSGAVIPAGTKISFTLYKGDVRVSNYRTLPKQDSCHIFRFASQSSSGSNALRRTFKCEDLEPNTTYSIQLIYHKDLVTRMLVSLRPVRADHPTRSPVPIDSLMHSSSHLGLLGFSANGTVRNYSDFFSCNSRLSLPENQCGSVNPSGGISSGGVQYGLTTWLTFETNRDLNLRLEVLGEFNNGLMGRLFADTITNDCGKLSSSQGVIAIFRSGTPSTVTCLPAGKYAVQLLGVDSAQFTSGRAHLGRRVDFRVTASTVNPFNQFSLTDTGRVDILRYVNDTMRSLPNRSYVNSVTDRFGCLKTPLPIHTCATGITKAMYRMVNIGDMDNNGHLDSGFLYIDGLERWITGRQYGLYKGNAQDLAVQQQSFQYPDTINGLLNMSQCISGVHNRYYCVTPGDYTFVSFGDDRHIGETDRPRFFAQKHVPMHMTPQTSHHEDTIRASKYLKAIEWTCHSRVDTIDGRIPCQNYNKIQYREFYLDDYQDIQISGSNGIYSLFTGRASQGLGGLKLYTDMTGDWRCFTNKSSNQCFPVSPGWYTLVTYGIGATFGDSIQNGERQFLDRSNQPYLRLSPPQTQSRFNRPYKAFFADSLLNSGNPLDYRDNYGTSTVPRNNRSYTLEREFFTCRPDTPFSIHPITPCNNQMNRFAYYVFSIKRESYVKITGLLTNMRAEIYAFDVRKDSVLMDSIKPLQNCNNNSHLFYEICRMQPGIYTLVCHARDVHDGQSFVPVIHLDSVSVSRFDHAINAYDFGAIPTSGQWIQGKVGTQHPTDTLLPPSNDFFFCTTGSQPTDPMGTRNCWGVYNNQLYPDTINKVHYNGQNSGTSQTNEIKRNLWYTFVLNGYGFCTVLQQRPTPGRATSLPFTVYRSRADATLPFDTLRARGLVDSTTAMGLTSVRNNYTSSTCFYNQSLVFEKPICDTTRAYRYYIEVSRHRSDFVNSQISFDIKFDTLPTPILRYNQYSQANLINGLNEIDGPYTDTATLPEGTFNGDPGTFVGATRNATDQSPSNCTYGTLWYKFRIGSSGAAFLRYRVNSGNPTTGTNVLTLVKEEVPGDSTSRGLRRINLSSSSGWLRACVDRGTYYILVSGCNIGCSDTITPILRLEYQSGDYCDEPTMVTLRGLNTSRSTTRVDCHTMGEAFGEDGSNLSCLFGPSNYKSSWFLVDFQDTGKVDLEFNLSQNTNVASNLIRYRVLYGTCNAMTSGPCNSNALTQFVLNCMVSGRYYVQVVSPQNATGTIELSVTSRRNGDTTCIPVDGDKPLANFSYSVGCSSDTVKFTNLSTQGSAIRYEWDFGWQNQKDTVIHPEFVYPKVTTPTRFWVVLKVLNKENNSFDTLRDFITIYPPMDQILGRDTFACEGERLTLDGYYPDAQVLWSTNQTSYRIQVTKSGTYWVELNRDGCKSRDSIDVVFFPLPEVNLGRDTSLCPGQVLLLDAGDGKESYVWQDSSILQTYQVSSSGLYYVSVLDSNGCVNSDTMEVVLQPFPDAAIVQAGPFCFNDGGQQLRGLVNGGGVFYGGSFIDSSGVFNPSVSGTGDIRIYYTVTDSIGCVGLDSIDVRVNALPDAGVVAAGPFCVDAGSQVVRASVNAGGRFYGGNFVDSMGNFDPEVAGIGNAKIYYTFTDTNTCTNVDSTVIKVNALPDAGIVAAGPFCVDEGVQVMRARVNSGGRFYGGNFVDSAGNFDPAVAGVGDTKMYYTFTDSNSCTNVDSTMIRVISLPDAGIVTTGPFCVDAGTQLVRARVNAGGRFYGGNFVDSAGNFNPSVAGAGDIKLYYIFTDSNTCTNIDSTVIRVNALPNAGIVAAGPFCVDAGAQVVRARVNSGGRFYGGNFVDSAGNFDPSVAGVGNAKVYYTYTDNNTCTNMDSTVVRVNALPDAGIVSAGPFCVDAGVQVVRARVNSGGRFYGGNYIDSAGNFDPAVAGIGDFKLYYTFTDSNSCTNVDSTMVRVNPLPDASIVTTGPFCVDAGTQLVRARVNSGGRFYGGSFVDSAGNFEPSVAGAGDIKLYYTFTDSNTCTNIDSTVIRVNALPDASIVAAGPFCVDAGVQVVRARVNSGGRFYGGNFVDSAGNFDPSVAGVGNAKVYYTYTDNNTCSNMDSTLITVHALPDAGIAAAGPFCVDAGVQVVRARVNSGGRFYGGNYMDSAGNFDPAVAGIGDSKMYYIFTDTNSCTNVDSAMIRVNPLPDAGIVAAGPFCVDAGTQLVRARVNSGGRFYGGNFVDSAGNFNPSEAGVGNAKVYYTYTDTNTCSNIDSTVIRVHALPDAGIVSAGPFCVDAGVQVMRASVNAGGRFYGGNFIDSAGNFDPSVAGVGNAIIYYTFTDTNTCSNMDSTIIRVNALPDAGIVAAGPFCVDAGVQVVRARVNAGGRFYGGNYIDSAGHFDPAVAGIGNFKLYYTFTDSNSCTSEDSTIISVNPLPDASIVAAGPFCVDAGVQVVRARVNAGGRFYGGNFVDSAGNFDPSVAGAGDIKLYYTFTDSNSCTNIDSTFIRVNALPDAGIVAAGPFCVDAGTQFVRARVNAGGRFYGGNFIDSAGNFEPSVAGVGNAIIYYTFTDTNTCSNMDSTIIRVNALPDAGIVAAGPFCLDAGVQVVRARVNAGGRFYGGNFVDSAGNFDPAVAGVGDSKMYYTFTDSNSCTNVDSTMVRVNPLPDASIVAAGPFCVDAGVQVVRARVNAGGRFYGGNFVDSAGNFDPSVAGAGDIKLYYTFTDSNSCTNIDSTFIRVNALPDAGIVAAGPFCVDAGTQFVRARVNAGGRFYGGNFVDSAGNFNPSVAGVGDIKVYYTFTDNNTCSNMDSTIIRVNALPDAGIVAAGPFCVDAGVQVVRARVNAGGRFYGGNYIDSAGHFDPAVAGIGDSKMYYIFTDTNSCTNVDSAMIRVNPLPDASIVAAGPFCEDAGTQLVSASVNPGGRFYGGNFVDSAGNFEPSVAGAGNINMFYSFTDSNLCTSVDSTIIRVNALPDATITVWDTTVICLMDSVLLEVSSGAGLEFAWYDTADELISDTSNRLLVKESGRFRVVVLDSNGCSSSSEVVIQVNMPSAARFDVSSCDSFVWDAHGQTYYSSGHYVTVGINVAGCDSLMDLYLEIHPSYVLSQDAFICDGQSYRLSDGRMVTTGGDYPVVLQSERGCDSVIQTRLVVHPTYEQVLTDTVCEREEYVLPDGRVVVGPGVYESMFNTREGCDSLIRTVLIENSEPDGLQVWVSPDPAQVVLGNSLILNASSTHGGMMEWFWEPGDDLSCDRCPNPTFTGTRSRTYTVRGVTESGCRRSRSVRIQVDGEYNVLFPNVFSPNDNGLNDVFKPGGLGVELTLDYYLSIYDRWGEKLFETVHPAEGWDGTYRGEGVQEGVYMYYARVTLENGERKMFKGTVTLLR
jgi:gliding motility-associated-like protein